MARKAENLGAESQLKPVNEMANRRKSKTNRKKSISEKPVTSAAGGISMAINGENNVNGVSAWRNRAARRINSQRKKAYQYQLINRHHQWRKSAWRPA
jgi:hypothetical protein